MGDRSEGRNVLNVYQRLNAAREEFHSLKLEKTGHNKFAGYKYFELADFLIPAMAVFKKHGLCAVVSFRSDIAGMRIVSVEDGTAIEITSPMGSAALKGCHEVQNIGAVETYQRRYLWTAALEIVEHDALDATTGKQSKDAKATLGDTHGGPAIVFATLSKDWQAWLKDFAPTVDNAFEQRGVEAAIELIEAESLDNEVRAGLESLLSSKTRSAMKRHTRQKEAA